jgi:hypothetical protein
MFHISQVCKLEDVSHNCIHQQWVSKIQEYDLEIKPTKIIKGQGLAQMLTENNQEAIQMGESEQINVVVSKLEHDEWYSDIIHYLKNFSCLPAGV